MDRPSYDYIKSLAEWTGGDIKRLAYVAYTMQTSINTPIATTSVETGGFWSEFWRDTAESMRYFRRQFHDDVSGSEKIRAFPENWVIRLPNTAPSKVREAVDQVFVGDPQIKVEVPKGYKDPEKRSQLERKLTKFCWGLIQHEERSSDMSPLEEQKINTIALGSGTRSILIDLTNWPPKPEKKRREKLALFEERMAAWQDITRRNSPFSVKSVHPLNYAYDRSNNPPQWFIIREPIMPWEAKVKYKHWQPNNVVRDNPQRAVQPLCKMQFWTPEWYACYIDGAKALGEEDNADSHGVAPNPYHCIPYWPSAGGHGSQDPLGRPEFELVGILRDNRDALLVDAEIFNLEEIYRWRASYGPKLIVSGPDQTVCEELANKVMTGPQKAVGFPPGYSVNEVKPSELPPALLDQRRRVDIEIERGMVYDVAAGAGNPTEPAARTRIRLQQVDKKLASAALNVQQSLESSFMAAIYMIRDVLKESVGVNVAQSGLPADYVDLSPDEIPDGIVVTAKLVGDSEEEKARRIQIGETRLGRTLDIRTFMTDFAQDPNPDGILEGMAEDVVRQTVIIPAIVSVLQGQAPTIIQEAAQEAGINPGLEVSPDGAVLPGMRSPGNGAGTAIIDEERNNPQVANPESPEALNQTLSLANGQQSQRRRTTGPPIARYSR